MELLVVGILLGSCQYLLDAQKTYASLDTIFVIEISQCSIAFGSNCAG
jgi:hypothetical protein